ncbi:MAG: M28 family peptidase [Candidatus Krumholzibacteriia bacterium]
MRVITTLLGLGWLTGVTAAAVAAGPAPGAAAIVADPLLADVRVLAGPACDGRLPGTAGYDSAAAWAAARFARLGLRPGGDAGGWRQDYPTEVNVVRTARLALARANGAVRDCRLGDDFVCRGFTGSGRTSAPVVFVGYGLSLPELGYDDYAGVDVAGKVALAFKQPPGWRLPGGGWGDAHLPRPKAAVAAAHGASALLLVSLSDSVQGGLPIGSLLEGPGPDVRALPQLHVSLAVAESLLAGSGATLADLRRQIDATRQPASRPLPGAVELTVESAYSPAATTGNVVAILPGRDAALAGEVVLIAAHLDHVGSQGGELRFPGANDNASGVAAVLALARAFVADGPARRTVVFALFAGEEQGLLGARFHAAHPAVPLARTVALLNLDCVAHGDSVQLGNGLSAPRLWALARGLDAAGERLSVAGTWGGGGADAVPFHEAGVPALYFATTHSYTHLHRPSDTPETLNGPLQAGLVRLAYRVAREVADGGYAREAVLPSR